jgi:hypothetical protein
LRVRRTLKVLHTTVLFPFGDVTYYKIKNISIKKQRNKIKKGLLPKPKAFIDTELDKESRTVTLVRNEP